MADHLSITATQTRDNVLSAATVTDIQDLSKTVKLLKLHVKEDKFSFKAGQWVDMFIPGIETVGGFSMCSAPDLLTSSRIFHLAIKYAKHPPAYWIHTKCQKGDEVKVRAGGDFFFDSETLKDSPDLLLLAGGVGINPLYSILLHFVSLLNSQEGTAETMGNSRKATLLFSARNQDELLFREELQRIQQNHAKNINIQFHCTQDTNSQANGVIAYHLSNTHIEGCLQSMDRSRTEVYICGPSPFITTMEAYCLDCHIPKHNIHYEKWW